jgi:hypothetical protein
VIGVDPASIVPLALTSDVADAPGRFAAVAADWIEDCYEADRFVWADHWHYASHELTLCISSRDPARRRVFAPRMVRMGVSLLRLRSASSVSMISLSMISRG